ncbi:SGNH hydrolase-type esterase domain-containing protein [Syncephalastrum racemosum]|uniref:SGNH hydrolase-type esterase domain-containing protein n=1 Tax=Syncephalastrum racemosum TaxID=13706 RepID=A0A1X2HAT0_SYNRA|nr:SGNH hydrolase-type esterase domain-containing protein [Syncephalastrum racemosum]
MVYVYDLRSITDHQVLQRDHDTQGATVDLGNGQERFYATGGPYTVQGKRNIYVGDVFVMAGQSNMRGHGFYTDPFTGQDERHSDILGVHVYASNERWTSRGEPTHRLAESPRRVHHTLPDPTVRNPTLLEVRGASLGLPFAAHYRELIGDNVPVGLIASAHGGTSIEDWSVERMDEVDDPSQDTLFGAMLARISEAAQNQITAVLWYQGETDACANTVWSPYGSKFNDLMDAMRSYIRDDLPVYYVQIGRHVRDDNEVKERIWSSARQGQSTPILYFPERNQNTAMVASIDCEMDDAIHLSARGLARVGRRLANAAYKGLQGLAREATPQIDSIMYEERRKSAGVVVRSFLVRFRYMHGERWQTVSLVQGFTLHRRGEGKDDLLPLIYSARIESDQSVRLFLTTSAKDWTEETLLLSYGYGKNPTCNLVTTSDRALLAYSASARVGSNNVIQC